MLSKYKLTIHRTQRGELLSEETLIVESLLKPKVGEGKALMVDPPIYETVVKVEELHGR